MNTAERACGRWREILPVLGVDPKFLSNKHGPCPACGGTDRYRWTDKDGRGSFFCNQCGAGDGFILLRKIHGWTFAEAAAKVDEVIGKDDPPPPTNGHAKPDKDDEAELERNRKRIDKVLAEATDRSVVERYLTSRGLSVFPEILQGHPSLSYFDENRKPAGSYPAMIAPVVGNDRKLKTLHRTYAADVPARKKLFPKIGDLPGSAVRLFECGVELGIAEGIETAIAAHELFGIPTWATINAGNMECFVPPLSVMMLRIFGDNDANFAGQKAAYTLANRLAINPRRPLDIEVIVAPPIRGKNKSDWLDVLNERKGTAQ